MRHVVVDIPRMRSFRPLCSCLRAHPANGGGGLHGSPWTAQRNPDDGQPRGPWPPPLAASRGKGRPCRRCRWTHLDARGQGMFPWPGGARRYAGGSPRGRPGGPVHLPGSTGHAGSRGGVMDVGLSDRHPLAPGSRINGWATRGRGRPHWPPGHGRPLSRLFFPGRCQRGRGACRGQLPGSPCTGFSAPPPSPPFPCRPWRRRVGHAPCPGPGG
jgi:hypothetical protein